MRKFNILFFLRKCKAAASLFIAAGLALSSSMPAESNDNGETNAKKTKPVDIGFTLEEVVVGTQIIEEQDITEYGGAITKITDRQIEELNAQDLPSALRRAPGVHISRHNIIGSYGGGDGGAVYIRGMGSGRPGSEISVLTDNVPRFVGVWTHPLMDVLPVDFASEITVYKGAQPVNEGNMSFGSVELESKRLEAEGLMSRLRIGGGSYSTFLETFEHGYRQGKFDYFIGQSYKASDGHRENSDGLLRNYYIHTAYRFSDKWELMLKGHFSDTWAKDPGTEDNPPPRGKFSVDDRVGIMELNYGGEITEHTATMYYDDGFINWEQWDYSIEEGFDTDTDWNNYGVRYKGSVKFAGEGRLIFGYDHDIYGGGYKEIGEEAIRVEKEQEYFSNTGPYLSALYVFGDTFRLTPSLGVRYTENSEFGGETAPQFGLTAEYKQTRVHGFASRGFNFPGLYSRFMTENWGGGGDWTSLNPERVDHWEIGATQYIGKNFRLNLTYFKEKGEDLLVFLPPPPPPPSFDNIEEFEISGAEAAAALTFGERADVFLGGTVIDNEPSDLPNSPEYTATAGVGLKLMENLKLYIDGQWVGERYNYNPRFPGVRTLLDPYKVFNARVDYHLPFFKESFGAGFWLSAENITDEEYEYKPGYPMPGPVVTGGLDISF